MPYLEVYEWEAQRWPSFHDHKKVERLSREAQQNVVNHLASEFKVNAPLLKQSYKRGASRGTAGSYIRQKRRVYDDGAVITTAGNLRLGSQCHLHVLVHEFAHHLSWLDYQAKPEGSYRAHGLRFKQRLGEVYAYCGKFLPHYQHNGR